MQELTHLSLFSGIGGLDLAAEWAGFQTVGQCEFADYPYKVLQKHWPDVPKWRDIRTLTGSDFYEQTRCNNLTVVSGGFPCQPHSLAGERLASTDERDLWSELFRVFCETNARWLVAENVRGLLSSENGQFFGRVLRDMALGGYSVGWMCFPAHAAGASFWGERVAIVAASPSVRRDCLAKSKTIRSLPFDMEMLESEKAGQADIPFYVEQPISEPIGRPHRNDDGISTALDRLKCQGNAVMPQQFYPIFQAIADIENHLNNTIAV
jgi:DNA (cytosine-5)-methyltransferase 1